ncbi:MAG: hypothetical protein IKZ25_04010 [Clostridia bacterium]|nr:hypothetical protein [Clostridia bacterium]
MNNTKIMDFLSAKISGKNKKYIILALVVLCFFMIIIPTDKKEETITQVPENETLDYIKKLEEKIKILVESIDGAGNTTVFLNCKNGEESKYATEKDKDYGEKVIVIRKEGGGETPIITKKIQPEITGAVIICDGAENKKVEYMITQAVSIALGVKTNNITVLKRR